MLLVVGRIGRPHGIRGEVTVEVRTDDPEARFAVGTVFHTDPAATSAAPSAPPITDQGELVRVPEQLTIEAARWHQGRLLVSFDGIHDRDVAEVLRDTLLWVDSAEVPPPVDPDEFNDHQLVGLAVVTSTGEALGEIARIDHAPASDLLVLRRPEGRTALIPFVKAIVPEVDLAVHDLRAWTQDVHRTVDDTPYGGGPGMVMRPEPWGAALDTLVPPGPGPLPRLVVPTPAGDRFSQAMAHEWAAESHLIFACGRYEGIDQRVLEHAATRMPVSEVSLGDYVLFGGEVAVLVIMEAVTRLLPGVLGNADSLAEESHAHGLLEAPVYTKPPGWRGHDVPEILRSGDHGRIARWRRDQALIRTARRRPDMLAGLAAADLDKRDVATLTGAGFQPPPADMAK